MHAASFESIARTVLIILLIYFAFKMIIRWFGPMILKYFLKKIGNKVRQQFNQPASGEKKEGEVVIDKKPKKGRGTNKNVGEYIDYEEID
ncbi:hypothetical protein BH23BAC2_BH23BAC2_12160 [soil metagenome]